MDRILVSVCTPSIRPEGLSELQKCLSKQTYQDFEWLVEIGIPERGHDLNKAYNRMIKRAKGEVFLSIQDYTRIPDDLIEKVVEKYKENKRTFYTIPLGKTDDWESIRWDWRRTRESCNYTEWEIDCGFCSIDALREIGGFDEQLDEFWSGDNLNVGVRANLLGYEFDILKTTEAVALDHDKLEKHPFRDNFNPNFQNRRLTLIQNGEKVNYLI